MGAGEEESRRAWKPRATVPRWERAVGVGRHDGAEAARVRLWGWGRRVICQEAWLGRGAWLPGVAVLWGRPDPFPGLCGRDQRTSRSLRKEEVIQHLFWGEHGWAGGVGVGSAL